MLKMVECPVYIIGSTGDKVLSSSLQENCHAVSIMRK